MHLRYALLYCTGVFAIYAISILLSPLSELAMWVCYSLLILCCHRFQKLFKDPPTFFLSKCRYVFSRAVAFTGIFVYSQLWIKAQGDIGALLGRTLFFVGAALSVHFCYCWISLYPTARHALLATLEMNGVDVHSTSPLDQSLVALLEKSGKESVRWQQRYHDRVHKFLLLRSISFWSSISGLLLVQLFWIYGGELTIFITIAGIMTGFGGVFTPSAKSAFENFLFYFKRRTFENGDLISVDGINFNVESVGITHTQLTDTFGVNLTVANLVLMESTLINATDAALLTRCESIQIQLPADLPVNELKVALTEFIKENPNDFASSLILLNQNIQKNGASSISIEARLKNSFTSGLIRVLNREKIILATHQWLLQSNPTLAQLSEANERLLRRFLQYF